VQKESVTLDVHNVARPGGYVCPNPSTELNFTFDGVRTHLSKDACVVVLQQSDGMLERYGALFVEREFFPLARVDAANALNLSEKGQEL